MMLIVSIESIMVFLQCTYNSRDEQTNPNAPCNAPPHLFIDGAGVPGALPPVTAFGLIGSFGDPISLAAASFCKKLIHNSDILYYKSKLGVHLLAIKWT
jgi:hypothetical protein